MELGIEHYNIKFLLGSGQFSNVFAVNRKKDYKPYVLKIQQLYKGNQRMTEMIKDEIKILDKMKHPNILSYYGYWEENQCIYILMEYASRGTLRDLIDSRLTPLNEKDAFYLFAQMVMGIHYIHSEGIIHRDIKPENIMLTGRNGDIIQIGDFGLSKNVNELTTNAGSYSYSAPEIFRGQTGDFSSDIWSMGVVLYEMVSGRLPFVAKTPESLSHRIRYFAPEFLDNGTSTQVVSIVSKVLRKNRLHRPTILQLSVCPYLIPHIIKIHLNSGRGIDLLKIFRNTDKFSAQIYKYFGD